MNQNIIIQSLLKFEQERFRREEERRKREEERFRREEERRKREEEERRKIEEERRKIEEKREERKEKWQKVGLIITVLGSLLTISYYTWWPAYYKEYCIISKIRKNFYKSTSFLSYCYENHRIPPMKRIEIPNQQILAIVTGESGIGKTTEICHLAKQLREGGET